MEPNLAVEGKLGRKKEFPDLIDLSGFQARKERRKKNRNNNKEERLGGTGGKLGRINSVEY